MSGNGDAVGKTIPVTGGAKKMEAVGQLAGGVLDISLEDITIDSKTVIGDLKPGE